MKYLSDYVEEKQSNLFKELGVFFAFSEKQLAEQKVEGVRYLQMGGGCICPAENCKDLEARIEIINSEGIAQDIADNGLEAIIQRELGNHEYQFTEDAESTVEALQDYGISQEMFSEGVKKYMRMCIEQNLF